MFKPRIKMIVATDDMGCIGKLNKLPWPFLREDMEFFKEATTGSIIVMGYKTWLSLPKKLPGRINVVISRDGPVEGADHTIIQHNDSMFAVLDDIKKIATEENISSVYVIGGKRTYELLLPAIDTIYLNTIRGDYFGDTYIDVKKTLVDFNIISSRPCVSNPALTFNVYRRIKNTLD